MANVAFFRDSSESVKLRCTNSCPSVPKTRTLTDERLFSQLSAVAVGSKKALVGEISPSNESVTAGLFVSEAEVSSQIDSLLQEQNKVVMAAAIRNRFFIVLKFNVIVP